MSNEKTLFIGIAVCITVISLCVTAVEVTKTEQNRALVDCIGNGLGASEHRVDCARVIYGAGGEVSE